MGEVDGLSDEMVTVEALGKSVTVSAELGVGTVVTLGRSVVSGI